MTRSLMLALVAALVYSTLAQACPCECEAPPLCPTVLQDALPPAPPMPSYMEMEIVSVPVIGEVGEPIVIVAGEATPDFLIVRALDGKGIENEWLAPLSCDELDLVEDALYARHKVDFEDDADEAFFATFTVGVYMPVSNLTREGAERLFSSQDNLTLLRVDRAQSRKDCKVVK